MKKAICRKCKKEFSYYPSNSKGYYCSRKCFHRSEDSNWKGGHFKSSNGYIWLLKPNHPFSSKVAPKGYIQEHRFVMEQKLGRYLIKGEVVHHINGIRDDNRSENLVLTISGKHIAKHNSERIWKETSKEKHRIKANKLKRNAKGQFIGY